MSSSERNNNNSDIRNNNSQSVVNPLLCAYCFDTIIEKLDGKAPQPPLNIKFPADKFPLFVTWKKKGLLSDYRLRGCIGTFSARELATGLKNYAIISAFEDPRFDPIKKNEIEKLKCDVSILTDFEKVKNYKDWTVGVHGITIEYTDPSSKKKYSATYLPEVAKEQGWNHDTTIEQLLQKSGYTGKITEQVKNNTNVTRYQSQKMNLTYQDYSVIRNDMVSKKRKSSSSRNDVADD